MRHQAGAWRLDGGIASVADRTEPFGEMSWLTPRPTNLFESLNSVPCF